MGARTRDAALSFASGASSFKPTSSISLVSQVEPSAVADWNIVSDERNHNDSDSQEGISRGFP